MNVDAAGLAGSDRTDRPVAASSQGTGSGGGRPPGAGAGALHPRLSAAIRGYLHQPMSQALRAALHRLEQARMPRTSALLEQLNRPARPTGEQLAAIDRIRARGTTPAGAAPGGRRRGHLTCL